MPVAIDIGLRCSGLLRVYLCALLLLTGLALLRLPLAPPVLSVLALLVCFYAYYGMRHYLSINSPACIARLSFAREQWFVEVGGELRRVELTQATVWQSLLALNFRDPLAGRSRRLVLLSDSCDSDELRQLRVLLKHFPVLTR